MRDTERGQTHRQREKQAPCKEPDTGLNPRSLGTCPEPKTDGQPLSNPGIPCFFILWIFPNLFSQSPTDEHLSHF